MADVVSYIKNSGGSINATIVDSVSAEMSGAFCDMRDKFFQASIRQPLSSLYNEKVTSVNDYYGNAFRYSGKVYGVEVLWNNKNPLSIAVIKPESNAVDVITTVDNDEDGRKVTTVMFDNPVVISSNEFIGASGGVLYCSVEDSEKYGLDDYGTVVYEVGNVAVHDNFAIIAMNLITDPLIGKYERYDSVSGVVAVSGNTKPSALSKKTFRMFATVMRKPEVPFDRMRVFVSALADDLGTHDMQCSIMSLDFKTALKEVSVPVSCDGSVRYVDVPISSDDMPNLCYVKCEFPVSSNVGISTSSENKSKYCVGTANCGNLYSLYGSQSYNTVDKKNNYCIYIEFIGNVPSQGNNKNIIYVGKYSFCDYESIQDAIDNCGDSEGNPVTIKILPGVYDRFSMTDKDKRLRHISMLGSGRDVTVIKSDTGNYYTPAAEIWTTGIVRDITFEMDAKSNNADDTYDYAYAVHSDFGSNGTTLYDSCNFISNAGPAFGMGMHANEKVVFTNCDFLSTGDGSFGSSTLGALFCHGALQYSQENQVTEFRGCLFVDENGSHGLNVTTISDYVKDGEWIVLAENCNSFNASGPEASVKGNILSKYSSGNNVDALNYRWV